MDRIPSIYIQLYPITKIQSRLSMLSLIVILMTKRVLLHCHLGHTYSCGLLQNSKVFSLGGIQRNHGITVCCILKKASVQYGVLSISYYSTRSPLPVIDDETWLGAAEVQPTCFINRSNLIPLLFCTFVITHCNC